ncbi:MAG TPA: hypothetical protein VD834_13140 [Blastococcus sp.]|nr:hypothetical protein [Blastococcus sp.]
MSAAASRGLQACGRLAPSQEAVDEAVLDAPLQALREDGWQHPTSLDSGQQGRGDPAVEQRGCQQPSGGRGVLHGEVDPNAADRRHRVGGVPDQQQSMRVPSVHTVHLHGKHLDVVPAADPLDRPVHTREQLQETARKASMPAASTLSNPPLRTRYALCQ